MPRAAELVWKHGIRERTRVHVAAAAAARTARGEGAEFLFLGSDQTQNEIAAREGLDVLDPTV